MIRIAPTSTDYINPMDINMNYSDDDNPLSLKADFILSLCELIVGNRDGLEPVEKTVIDRCVRIIYQPYLNDPKPENIPILATCTNACWNRRSGKPAASPRRWRFMCRGPLMCSITGRM